MVSFVVYKALASRCCFPRVNRRCNPKWHIKWKFSKWLDSKRCDPIVVPNPSKLHVKGRPKSTRIRNEMHIIELQRRQTYSHYRCEGHNRNNCSQFWVNYGLHQKWKPKQSFLVISMQIVLVGGFHLIIMLVAFPLILVFLS